MGKKSKCRSKRRAKPQKPVTQCPLKSSWRSAAMSFLKEYFFNHGVGGYFHDFDEELNDEGLWKKKLIWAPHLLIAAVVLAIFPFYRKDVFAAESAPMEVFTFLVFEVTAIGMGIGGIIKIKDAIRIKLKNKAQKEKGAKMKNQGPNIEQSMPSNTGRDDKRHQ